MEKFGDFLKEKLAGKDESAVALVREMKKFIDMTNTLTIDGTYIGTLDGKNKSESELNARTLSAVISDLSKRFYELLYKEPEETFKNKYDTYLGADLTLKGNCQQYLDSKGIQEITIILAFNQLPQSSLTRYVRRQIAVSAVVDPVKSAESGSAQSADIFNRVIIRVPPSFQPYFADKIRLDIRRTDNKFVPSLSRSTLLK